MGLHSILRPGPDVKRVWETGAVDFIQPGECVHRGQCSRRKGSTASAFSAVRCILDASTAKSGAGSGFPKLETKDRILIPARSP